MNKVHENSAPSVRDKPRITLVFGPAACGKSTWLEGLRTTASSTDRCLVRASDVWGSWEHGEPEAVLSAAFQAAVHCKAHTLYIDDLDFICSGLSSASIIQPVALRLEDLVVRILDSCTALGVSVVATCIDVQRLPARLMTPQRFNKAVDFVSFRPVSGLPAAAAAAHTQLRGPRLPACMGAPRAVKLQDLLICKQVLDEIRVDCILPLVSPGRSTSPAAAPHTPVKPLACNGVLLYGPSGNGKTALAHAIAYSVRTSGRASAWVVDSAALVSKFVGETETALAAVFQHARAEAPCLLVLDGIDALVPGSARSASAAQSSRTWDRVLSTLLTELDGIHTQGGHVALLATANAVGAVDEALRRPGRLGTHLYLGPPSPAQAVVHAQRWAAAAGTGLKHACAEAFEAHSRGHSHAQVKGILAAAARVRVRHSLHQGGAALPAEEALMTCLQASNLASGK